MTLKVFTEITSTKEKRNTAIHRQNKMCSVTKAAKAFVLVTDTYKQLTRQSVAIEIKNKTKN